MKKIKHLLLIIAALFPLLLLAQTNPAADADKNWIQDKIYDGQGNLIGLSRQYFDPSGSPTQSQTIFFSNGAQKKVITTQSVYDAFGRPVLQTLPAPLKQDDIGYMDGFITNSSGDNYNYEDFDQPNTSSATSGEVDNPKSVDNSTEGTLGWYYSDNNTWEGYVPASGYPYSRTEFFPDPLGRVKRSAGPGENLRMGSGHEVRTFTMPAAGELYYLFGMIKDDCHIHTDYFVDDNTELHDSLYTGTVDSSEGYFRNEEGCESIIHEYKINKTITVDPHGVESITFTDLEGNVVATCLAGQVDGQNVREQHVVKSIKTREWIDIHLPQGCASSLDIQGNGVGIEIYDLETGDLVSLNSNNALPPGHYRIKHDNTNDPNTIYVYYTLNYYNFSLYYYDRNNRLIKSVPPAGIDRDYEPAFDVYDHHSEMLLSDLTYNQVNEKYTPPLELDLPATPEGKVQFTNLLLSLEWDPPVLYDDDGSTGGNTGGTIGTQETTSGESIPYVEELHFNGEPAGTESTSGGSTEQTQYLSSSTVEMQQTSAQAAYGPSTGTETGTSPGTGTGPGGSGGGGPPPTEDDYCEPCDQSGSSQLSVEVNITMEADIYVSGDGNDWQYLSTQTFNGGWTQVATLADALPSGVSVSSSPVLINQEMSRWVKHVKAVVTDISGHITKTYLYETSLQQICGTTCTVPSNFEVDLDERDDMTLNLDATRYVVQPEPEHTMTSVYRYNSLGWLLWKATPDAHRTEYLYDSKGRIRFSQNAKQRQADIKGKFSYTNYDRSGRVVEMGEYDPGIKICALAGKEHLHVHDGIISGGSSGEPVEDKNKGNNPTGSLPADLLEEPVHLMASTVFLLPPDVKQARGSRADSFWYFPKYIQPTSSGPGGNIQVNPQFSGTSLGRNVKRIADDQDGLESCRKLHVTRYSYDEPADDLPGSLPARFQQRFLTGEVSRSRNGQSTTWYSYDELGRVEWVVQKLPDIGVKTIEYTYDFNGNVCRVSYQAEQNDAFYHHFVYDEDLRLKKVITSFDNDSIAGMVHAEFEYYTHGPLKRIELGDQTQGLDYVYTIQGWLKSINNPKGTDPGQDGVTGSNHAQFAPDAFTQLLEYHTDDYSRTGSGLNDDGTASSFTDLYNGNIKAQRWTTTIPTSATNISFSGQQLMYGHDYDQKDQLIQADFGTVSSGVFTDEDDYKVSGISYDPNGNIKTLQRKGPESKDIDNFTYSYNNKKNQLNHITDAGTDDDGNYQDLATQSEDNYTYSKIGELIADAGEGVYYEYNLYGKVTRIWKNEAMTQPLVKYYYNSDGFLIKRKSYNKVSSQLDKTTWYARDIGGNVMSIYEKEQGEQSVDLEEMPLYGSARLGVMYAQGGSPLYTYELFDHLGNTRAVVERNRDAGENLQIAAINDFYPFGWKLPNRTFESLRYRFGYQGQFAEEDEVTKMSLFELRQWDGRMGRWANTDIYGQHYSPYLGMGNNPISNIDPDGGIDGPNYKGSYPTAIPIYGEIGIWNRFTNMVNNFDPFLSGGTSIRQAMWKAHMRIKKSGKLYETINNDRKVWNQESSYDQLGSIAGIAMSAPLLAASPLPAMIGEGAVAVNAAYTNTSTALYVYGGQLVRSTATLGGSILGIKQIRDGFIIRSIGLRMQYHAHKYKGIPKAPHLNIEFAKKNIHIFTNPSQYKELGLKPYWPVSISPGKSF